ncbi:MAG: HAMP domain-containing histidine kinase [Acidobacteria bacterium]|nr:HAMP domain-containing histidine kinase [Acidobacteriota bacterium]
MTTQDEVTIQDASMDFWRLVGSDLFVLADRTGRVVALQTATRGFDRQAAQVSVSGALQRGATSDWWFGQGHLYETFLMPIYFGSPANNVPIGMLAVGYEIDKQVAEVVRRVASGHVAFSYGSNLVVSTLAHDQQAEFARRAPSISGPARPGDMRLAGEEFIGTSVDLSPAGEVPVRLTVLKSYDQATAFLNSLNRLLLGVGLVAILAGSALVFLLAHTFTRPLSNLVSGVHALEKGDFSYPLDGHSNDEVEELTMAFDNMRNSLQNSQRELLQADRLATVGRMASSISHDLRHPLTAILAYAEFLSDNSLNDQQRKELYGEIRMSVARMTDLISSLLDFSKGQQTLTPAFGNIREPMEHAIHVVRARPEFARIGITLSQQGVIESWFDAKKLERVFHNLLLNACEAVSPESGKIELTARRTEGAVEIRVADNGPGIPPNILDSIFQPFVSHGKENGTGLGLAVAHKIVQDHGGEICVESTGEHGSVFALRLPLSPPRRVFDT